MLRNYVAQNAISEAEDGNFAEVRRVLQLLEDPYNDAVKLGDNDVLPAEGATTSTVEESSGKCRTRILNISENHLKWGCQK